MSLKVKILFALYCLLFIFYFLYSYSFLDPNLTLTSFKPYLWMQKEIRWWGFFNKPQSSLLFAVLTPLIFAFYYLICGNFFKKEFKLKQVVLFALVIGMILVFSYPAFSYDIFNYIFNAKMVLEYGADPHQRTAMEFKDPMLGFMRNVHTPAPYFYGWTLASLLPYCLGLGRIFPEIISFKVFSAVSLFGCFFILKKIYSIYKINHYKLRLTLFLLNPLILIEIIGVGHNDLIMMFFALTSFYFLIKFKNEKKLQFLIYSLLFIAFSVSNKYATVVLIPLFFIWYFKQDFDIGSWGALLLFMLPFSRPLNQLHSWYLIWPLSWSFLSKKETVVYLGVFLSFFALMRYVPFIYYGHWNYPVHLLRLIIYFAIPLLVVIWKLINSLLLYNSKYEG